MPTHVGFRAHVKIASYRIVSCLVFLTYSVETKTRNYDTIREACAQKLTRVRSIYRTEPTTKKWKNRKPKSKNNGHAQKHRQKVRESVSGSDGMLLRINVTSDISYNTSNDSYNIFNWFLKKIGIRLSPNRPIRGFFSCLWQQLLYCDRVSDTRPPTNGVCWSPALQRLLDYRIYSITKIIRY